MTIHLQTTCPRCGWPVLLIAGATFKQDEHGHFIVTCIRCEESSSAKTLTGRAERK